MDKIDIKSYVATRFSDTQRGVDARFADLQKALDVHALVTQVAVDKAELEVGRKAGKYKKLYRYAPLRYADTGEYALCSYTSCRR